MINEIGIKLIVLNYQLQAEKVHTWKSLLIPRGYCLNHTLGLKSKENVSALKILEAQLELNFYKTSVLTLFECYVRLWSSHIKNVNNEAREGTSNRGDSS